MLQYASGTKIFNTISSDTKTLLIGGIESGLTGAGWTVISGGSSTDVKLQSLAIPSGGNQIRVRVWDGGANCVRIRLMNQAETVVQTDSAYLFPNTAKIFNICANRHQFAIFSPGSVGPRDFAMVSALFIPPHLQSSISTCAFLMSQGRTDTDTSGGSSFRLSLHSGLGGFGTSPANFFGIVNSSTHEASNLADGGVGSPALFLPQPANKQAGYLWYDGSALVVEPLIGWGLTGLSAAWTAYGQLWDAALVSDAYTMDTVPTSFDGKNWVVLTNTNNTNSATNARGTLVLVTP